MTDKKMLKNSELPRAAVLLLLVVSATELPTIVHSGCPRAAYDECRAGEGMTIICWDELYAQDYPCYVHNYVRTLNIKLLTLSGYTENNSEENRLIDSVRIQSIDASGINSIISIPPVVFTWPNLLSLNFSQNSLSNWNLDDYRRLLKLETLDLSHNAISLIDNDNDVFPNKFAVLQKLYLQNNEIEHIPDRLFETFNNIRQLDLSHNMITSLNLTTFDGLKKISYLDISHNKIVILNLALMRSRTLNELYLHNNNIAEITSFDFQGLNNLVTLTLNDNLLNVNQDIFSSLINLEKLNLSHNEIVKISKEVIYNDKLVYLDLSYNIISSIEPGAFKNQTRLTTLDLEGNRLEGSLMRGQLDGLAQIQHLNFSNHKLSQIDDFAFLGVINLMSLNMSYNILSSIAKSGFKTLTKLAMLDLSNNMLMEISFDTTDLNKLTWFSLKNNQLSELTPHFTEQLVSLQYLDISGNNIVHLHSDIFSTMLHLKDLFIANNSLHGAIEERTFSKLVSVPQLDLSHTNITGIANDSFSGMKALAYLNISFGYLSHVEYNAFSDTGLLRVLDLSHNLLEQFNLNNSQLQSLEELILNYNFITYIASDTLVKLSSLKHIYLAYNRLAFVHDASFRTSLDLHSVDLSFNDKLQINTSCFRNLHNLTQLTMSGVSKIFIFTNTTGLSLKQLTLAMARITDLESLGLHNIESLEILDLKSNDIQIITKNGLTNLQNMVTLDLSFNKIATVEPGSFKDTSALLYLNLAHNKISTIGYGNLLGLHNLQTLDLSYNKIVQINVHRLYSTSHLDNLIIDGNLIKDIRFEDFVDTRIRTISIGDNPLHCQQLIDYKMKYASRNSLSVDAASEPSYRFPTIFLTALLLQHDRENVDGIACVGADVVPVQLPSNTSMSDHINKHLEDIKVILNDIKVRANQTRPLVSSEDLIFIKENIKNVSTTLQSSFNNKTISNGDVLERIYSILKESRQDSDMLAKIYSEVNNLTNTISDNKNYRSELVVKASERVADAQNSTYTLKQFVSDEIKAHLTNLDIENGNNLEVHAKNDLKSAYLTAIRDVAYANSTSKFTEVCIGLILATLLGGLAYAIYLLKFKKTHSSYRSASTQEMSISM